MRRGQIGLLPEEMHVVSGVLVSPSGAGVLMGLRARDALRPLMWEFPGGKVDPMDAGPEAALAREWSEEMAVEVLVGERISTGVVYADACVLVELFEVSVIRDLPGAQRRGCDRGVARGSDEDVLGSRVHEDTRWVTPELAVRHLGCSPAFYEHYPFLRLWWARRTRERQT